MVSKIITIKMKININNYLEKLAASFNETSALDSFLNQFTGALTEEEKNIFKTIILWILKNDEEKTKKKINALPKDKVLLVISKISSLLANWKSKVVLIQMNKIRKEWKEKIGKVLSDPKFKNIETKNVKIKKEFCVKLLEILTGENFKTYTSEFLKGVKKMEDLGFYRRKFCPLNVNLDKELDVENLNYNTEKYWIKTRKMQSQNFDNIIEDGYEWIHVRNGNSWRSLSLRKYYDENMDKFSPTTLKSKDLLDQIFVIYVIKRAQNGDKKALQKLYDCYIETAKKIALRKFSTLKFSGGGQFDKSNLESIASSLLWILLGGDSLEKLPFCLENNLKVDLQLTRKLEDKILNIYWAMFFQLEFSTEYLFHEWKKWKKKIKNLKYNLKKSTLKNNHDSLIRYAIKICNISLQHLGLVKTISSAISYSLDPYFMLAISPKFNKYLYIPTKGSNLTTWLFGNGKKWRGMFWQKLNDWYKSVTYTKNRRRFIKPEDLELFPKIVFSAKTGKRKCISKEEFLENFPAEIDKDIISLGELKNQEIEEEW